MSTISNQSAADLAQIIKDLLESDVGRQTIHKIEDGQGRKTTDGKAWMRAQAFVASLGDAELDAPQSPAPQVVEFIGLKSRATGELARLHTTDEDAVTRYYLSNDSSHPHFKADSLCQVERLLLASTAYYNATETSPSWGDFDGNDLVPVRVRVTVEAEEFEMPPVLTAKTVDTRDTHAKIAKSYAGREIVPDGEGHLVFWLVHRPDGLSLDEMKAWEGQHVYSAGCSTTRRKVYAVCEVPEEYVPELKGNPGALLIASETRYV